MHHQDNNFNTENESSKNTIKQLYKDNDTGKIIITDCNNNKYETDIFGRKTINFLPKITGVISGSERKKINLIKFNNHSASPSNNNTIQNENKNNNYHSKKVINYHPKINRLDGFSFFPRPISLPFYNIPDYEMQTNEKKEINKELQKYYDNKDKIKNNKKNKILLSYLTNDLSEYNIGEKDKEKLINLIDISIEELKEEYKKKLNTIDKDPYFIALTQFKKKLLLSKKNQIKLNEPPNEIKRQYQFLHNINKSNTVNKKIKLMKKKENKYIDNYFKNRGKNDKLIKIEKDNLYKKIDIFSRNYTKDNLIIGPDKLNDICRSKDFGIGRIIKMDFGSFSYEEKDKKLSLDKNNTEINKEDNNDSQSMNKLPIISNNNNMKSNESKENLFNNIDKDTAETVTNMIRNNTDFNIIVEKIEGDELSFISRENENENNNNKKSNTNIRTVKLFQKYCEHEKNLLEGIKSETPREQIKLNINPNFYKKFLKNNGELYKKDIALLKMTNPKKFNLIEKKNEYDMKLLIKKLNHSRKKLENNINSN